MNQMIRLKVSVSFFLMYCITQEPNLYAMMDEPADYEELSSCHICMKQSPSIKANEQHLNTVHAKQVREDAEKMKWIVRTSYAKGTEILVEYGIGTLVPGPGGRVLAGVVSNVAGNFVDNTIKELDSKLSSKNPAPKRTSVKKTPTKKAQIKKSIPQNRPQKKIAEDNARRQREQQQRIKDEKYAVQYARKHGSHGGKPMPLY